jgi:hypothetical protein
VLLQAVPDHDPTPATLKPNSSIAKSPGNENSRYYSLWLAMLAVLFPKSAISKCTHHYSSDDKMNTQPMANQFNDSAARQEVSYFTAKEFQFKIWAENPALSRTKQIWAKEVIQHDQRGSLDLMLIPQGEGIKVVMQISHNNQVVCMTQAGRSCSQRGAAPARGNVAELQWSVPTHRLKPGTYHLGRGGSTPQAEVISHWPNFAANSSQGHPGCQRWGDATLMIKRVDIDASGKLASLNGSFTRICEQSLNDSSLTREEQLGQTKTESPSSYVIHASWWSRLTNSPR